MGELRVGLADNIGGNPSARVDVALARFRDRAPDVTWGTCRSTTRRPGWRGELRALREADLAYTINFHAIRRLGRRLGEVETEVLRDLARAHGVAL